MNAAPNFRELLSMPSDGFKRPPALPEGHYRAIIKNHEFGTSSKKKTPFVRFLVTPTEPTEDVDADLLEGIDLSKKEFRKDYYITPDALYRLREMLDSVLGEQEGRSFDERIPDTRGVEVIIGISQRVDDNSGEVFNDVNTLVGAPSAA